MSGSPQVVALEHVEHLDQGDPARARRRHRHHLVAPIGAPDRLAHARRVGGQIGLGDQPPVRGHLPREQRRGSSRVEPGRPVSRDELERAGEVRLAEAVAGRVGRPVVRERRDRGGVARHPPQGAGQRSGARVGKHEAVPGQGYRRLHQPPPRQAAVVGPGAMEPRDRARHPDRDVAGVVARRVVGAV